MKKKLFVGFAAAALAAVMCVSFAACGESGESIAERAESNQGEEVTAEEWVAAFEYLQKKDAVFTVELFLKTGYNSSLGKVKDSHSETTTGTVIKNNKKEYWKEVYTEKNGGVSVTEGAPKSETGVIEQYTERERGELYTLYDNTEDGWAKDEHAGSIATATTIFGGDYNFFMISNSYSGYKYSAEDKGYILESVPEGEPSFIIKFNAEKKLAAIYCSYEYESEEELGSTLNFYTYSIVITYTAKELTMPKVKAE